MSFSINSHKEVVVTPTLRLSCPIQSALPHCSSPPGAVEVVALEAPLAFTQQESELGPTNLSPSLKRHLVPPTPLFHHIHLPSTTPSTALFSNNMPNSATRSSPLPSSQTPTMPETTTSPSSSLSPQSTARSSNIPPTEAEPLPSSIPNEAQHLNLPPSVEAVALQDLAGAQSTESVENNEMASTTEQNISEVNAVEEEDEEMKIEEFTLFPKFPPELRLKIWKAALPGPRVVEIEWFDFQADWFCPKESQSQNSGLARANRESREVYLKTYVPLVKHCRVITSAAHCFHEFSKHATYFDPTIDTLYIGTSSTENLCVTTESFTALGASPWMQKVCRLAVEYQEWLDSDNTREETEPYALSFVPNLREIILINDDIEFRDLLSNNEMWVSRPHAEIEFIHADDSSLPEWVEEVASWYNENLPKDKIVKFTMKNILRGGNRPGIVRGYRNSHVSDTEGGNNEESGMSNEDRSEENL